MILIDYIYKMRRRNKYSQQTLYDLYSPVYKMSPFRRFVKGHISMKSWGE